MDAAAQALIDAVEGMLAMRKLAPETIAAIFGAALAGNEERSNRFFAVFEGPCDSDIARKLEVRVPLSPKGRQDALVIVTLPRDFPLDSTATMSWLGEPGRMAAASPDALEGRTDWRYDHGGGVLTVSFDPRSGHAVSVVVDRASWR